MGQEERQLVPESTEELGQVKQPAEVPPLQVAHDWSHATHTPLLLYSPVGQEVTQVEAERAMPAGQVRQAVEVVWQVVQGEEQARQVPVLL